MPQSRASQVSLIDTPYYHCVSRCVRRTYLCGKDSQTSQDYSHRQGWVEQRLLSLGSVFAIDICAYAVMSNHSHVVLHVDKEEAEGWSVEEVLHRWHQIHKGTMLTQRYILDAERELMSESERFTVEQTADVYRQRLYSISWFMRNLNEYIAREANKEDDCTGRFWEGRFKSQALLDESALAACMAYVDLNPVRAKVAKTLEDSAYTSIQQRTKAAKYHDSSDKIQPAQLLPFCVRKKEPQAKALPFHLTDYLELVDITGRCIRADKKGYIDPKHSPILKRLGLDKGNWLTLTTEFEQHFSYAVGAETMMQQFKVHTQHQRIRGINKARQLLTG